MCGIAAIFSYHNNTPPVDREELRKIRDYMKLRGPDGKGEWYSNDQRVGLAHRRLAIIDLSSKAAQPMVNSGVWKIWHYFFEKSTVLNTNVVLPTQNSYTDVDLATRRQRRSIRTIAKAK